MRYKLAAALLLIAAVTYAAEVRVSLSQLVKDSDRIARGRVVSFMSYPGTNAFGDELIYTDVLIDVHEALKGERSYLTVTVEGGTVNGVRLQVSNAPEFKMGQEVIVFAKRGLTTYHPAAGTQSRLTISAGGEVVEKKMPYAQFRKIVLAELNKGKVAK